MAENALNTNDNSLNPTETRTEDGGSRSSIYTGNSPYVNFMYQNPHFSWCLPFFAAIITYYMWFCFILRIIKGSK